jgi:Rha family phage regulatory protein
LRCWFGPAIQSGVREIAREVIGRLAVRAEQLRVRTDGLVPLVNSRDVADRFGKRHDNVLRDIKALEQPLDLRTASWFRMVDYVGENGKTELSFDMTRDGFTLLVMGWTGVSLPRSPATCWRSSKAWRSDHFSTSMS